MTNTSQETCSHSMYPNNNLSHRCNHYHPKHLQCNVGSKRSLNNCSCGTFGTNRKQLTQPSDSWSIPELVRETGLILEVQREYGRILSQSNFSTPNIHIYFSLSTLVNDAPLSAITDNLTDIFQAGAMICYFAILFESLAHLPDFLRLDVEIEVDGGVNLKELKDHVHVILTCTFIRPSTEIGRKPELVPMILIQDDHEIPLALIANHELVALPRQVFPIEEVTSAFMAKKNSVTTNVEWPEFATIGRSIEGRILSAPPWIREFTNPGVKKIAVSIQRFGRDREGFAVIKECIKRGVILTPIDEEDKKICGDLFFPYEMRIDASRAVTEYEDVYRLGSKWYFRACPELPNRKYKYRAYSLNSLDDVLNDNLTARERFHEQTVKRSIIANRESVTADIPTSATEAVTSTNHEPDDSHQLIKFDNELLPMSSSKATAISPVTLDLLSDVNFDVSPATTVSGINETVIRQNSNSSNMADCNLLVDFDIADDVQQLATQVRRFHVLDEDFNLSSINFDFKRAKECNYKAGIFGCNGHENNEDMCMTSQIKESGNINSNRVIYGFNTPEEPVEVESNNGAQLIDINTDLPISGQDVDTSDDSENEMFHAVAVKRRNDNGWWFTRRASNKTDSVEDSKINEELMRPPSLTVENSKTTAFNSIPEDDKPLVILTDDHVNNCETTSLTMSPQISLSNALQNDGIYAKFFAGLLQK